MRICVFLGSSMGNAPVYAETARSFGALLARRGIGLVYGGGSIGLMGQVADGACAAGGEVIGVIPEALRAREQDHQGLTALHVTSTMHERKALMAELSSGFVALPGGVGTIEELAEVITWRKLGQHTKPILIANFEGFWQPLLGLLEYLAGHGFVREDVLAECLVVDDPAGILPALRQASVRKSAAPPVSLAAPDCHRHRPAVTPRDRGIRRRAIGFERTTSGYGRIP